MLLVVGQRLIFAALPPAMQTAIKNMFRIDSDPKDLPSRSMHSSRPDLSNQDILPNPSNNEQPCNDGDHQVSRGYTSILSNVGTTLVSSLRWCPTSEQELANAESELLSGKSTTLC